MDLVATLKHFRDLHRGYEHWILAVDGEAAEAIHRMRNRFFADAGPDDFLVCSLPPWPIALTLVAARKRRIMARDLRRHLARYTPAAFLPSKMDRDAIVLTIPEHLTIAARIVTHVLGSGDLSILAEPAEQQEAAA